MGLTIGIIIFAAFIFVTVVFLASRYKRCPSNRILVVFGRVSGKKSAQCYHGGGALVWPLIQDYSYLDLTPLTINIDLRGALSQQNIRINVPSTFTVAVGTEPSLMMNAANRLLNQSEKEIYEMAMEIIIGQLRLTIASLLIEDINRDREKFKQEIFDNVEPELAKIGLYMINVNITDITDESGYIEAIGKKAASTAINQAKIDVAEQNKRGAIGEADADRERRINVASLNAEAVEKENEAKARIAGYNANLAEKEAEADKRGKVAQQKSQVEIQEARAEAEAKRLHAEEVVPREIEKNKVEIDAEAAAERKRREAKGEADSILAIRTAEAEGVQKVLDAKSEGYGQLVRASESDPAAAASLLLVEKLEEIVKLQVEAIKNIKIDKVTVWDSGDSEKGSATANFLSSFVKTLPSLQDITKMVGFEMPDYLGKATKGDLKKEAKKKEVHAAANE